MFLVDVLVTQNAPSANCMSAGLPGTGKRSVSWPVGGSIATIRAGGAVFVATHMCPSPPGASALGVPGERDRRPHRLVHAGRHTHNRVVPQVRDPQRAEARGDVREPRRELDLIDLLSRLRIDLGDGAVGLVARPYRPRRHDHPDRCAAYLDYVCHCQGRLCRVQLLFRVTSLRDRRPSDRGSQQDEDAGDRPEDEQAGAGRDDGPALAELVAAAR